MVGISIIMPSYLGEYPGSRKDPDKKFIRAVESFRSQNLKEKELIIVSDGCEITNQIYQNHWENDLTISLIKVEKQKGWPGKLREAARCFAKYEWIGYLDSDDMFSLNYLNNISNIIIKNNIKPSHALTTYKYVFPIENGQVTDMHEKIIGYSKDVISNHLSDSVSCPFPYQDKVYNPIIPVLRQLNSTWQIIHHNSVKARWTNVTSSSGGEDKQFISDLLKEKQEIKSNHIGYVVCHHADRSLSESTNLIDF